MSEKFQPGDIVFHRLNGLRMVATSVTKLKRRGRMVECEWQDEQGKFRDRVFHSTSLTHIDPTRKEVMVNPNLETVGYTVDK